jgi:hypothetical protein
LRLDFDNFDIVETATGVCTDSLTIGGPTGRNPMDLCGTLTGMHGKLEICAKIYFKLEKQNTIIINFIHFFVVKQKTKKKFVINISNRKYV